jgi:hypothetical protein
MLKLSFSSTITRLVMAGALGSTLLLPSLARAQQRDPAAAQALFDQGKELMRQKRFAEACPKLHESNRLDPGIGTQFHLADCYEQSGRVASAWAAFLEVASQARATGQLDREKAAQKRAEKLEPRLPRLVVEVPEASKTPGLEIHRNDVAMGAAQWGTPVPVDPGEIELTASAPGKQPSKQTLRLEEGKTASYSPPALLDAPALVASAAAPPPDAPANPPPQPERDAGAASGGSSSGPWIITLAAVGVVGIGVGTTFAILAKNKNEESLEHCPNDPNKCSTEGVALRNSAIEKGNVATVAFIAGGAALAGAGIVWLVSSLSDSKKGELEHRHWVARPGIGPGLASLSVERSF